MFKRLKNIISLIVILSMLLLSLFVNASCEKKLNNNMFLGNLTSLQLYDGNTNNAKKEIDSFLEEFEKLVSVNIQGSDVDKINNALKGQQIAISPHTYNLLKRSIEIYDLTNGAFSPFTYNLSKLWGFTVDGEYPDILPVSKDVEHLVKFAAPDKASENIELLKNNIVVKKHDEVKIDLGAIAKGYASEKCVQIAIQNKVTSGLINIAGNIYVIGRHKEDRDFLIGISDPRGRENNNSYFAKINLADTSISVSGDYQRFFMRNDKRFCHILDPKSGMPISNDVISVVIIDAKGMDADAFSTAVMVKGFQKGSEFLAENNLTGIVISSSYKYKAVGNIILTDIYKGYTSA